MTIEVDAGLSRQLRSIKARYFRPVIAHPGGVVTHHGDCRIYRSRHMHGHATCTCGLLHDLRPLPGRLAERIYPKFWEQEGEQELVGDEQPCPVDPAEAASLMADLFKNTVAETDAEAAERERYEDRCLTLIFGEDFQ